MESIYPYMNKYLYIKTYNEETLSLFKEGQGYLRFLRGEKLLCRNVTNDIPGDIECNLIVIEFNMRDTFSRYILSVVA